MTHYASEPSLILGSNFQEHFKYNFIIRDRTFLFECKNQLFPSPLFRPSSGYQPEKVINDVTVSIAKLMSNNSEQPSLLMGVNMYQRGVLCDGAGGRRWFYHQVPEYVTHCDYMLPSDQGSPQLPSPPTPDHSTP